MKLARGLERGTVIVGTFKSSYKFTTIKQSIYIFRIDQTRYMCLYLTFFKSFHMMLFVSLLWENCQLPILCYSTYYTITFVIASYRILRRVFELPSTEHLWSIENVFLHTYMKDFGLLKFVFNRAKKLCTLLFGKSI